VPRFICFFFFLFGVFFFNSIFFSKIQHPRAPKETKKKEKQKKTIMLLCGPPRPCVCPPTDPVKTKKKKRNHAPSPPPPKKKRSAHFQVRRSKKENHNNTQGLDVRGPSFLFDLDVVVGGVKNKQTKQKTVDSQLRAPGTNNNNNNNNIDNHIQLPIPHAAIPSGMIPFRRPNNQWKKKTKKKELFFIWKQKNSIYLIDGLLYISRLACFYF